MLIDDDSIINQKRFQILESIYRLISDDSTINQKIFQALESGRSDQNLDVDNFDPA
jgi:hypothetical protein